MIQEIELFKAGPAVYGKAYGYINFEKDYNIIKLLHDQLVKEVDGKNRQISILKEDYAKLAMRLPEFEEMKNVYESLRTQTIDLQKDNITKANYISCLQMKLVIAMAEIQRFRSKPF